MKSTNWKIGGAIILMALVGLMLVGCLGSGPLAIISGPPGVVKSGEEVSFSGRLSQGSIVKYEWEVRPNVIQVSNSNGSGLEVIFPEGGEYTVSLTVTDTNGFRNTDTFYLTVEGAEPSLSGKGPEIAILVESDECLPLVNGRDFKLDVVSINGIGALDEYPLRVLTPCQCSGEVEYLTDSDIRLFIDRGEVERSADGSFWYYFHSSGEYHMAVFRGEEFLCGSYVNVISQYSPHLP